MYSRYMVAYIVRVLFEGYPDFPFEIPHPQKRAWQRTEKRAVSQAEQWLGQAWVTCVLSKYALDVGNKILGILAQKVPR